jgi:hypothetical protein
VLLRRLTSVLMRRGKKHLMVDMTILRDGTAG